jgi:hypothetical protein
MRDSGEWAAAKRIERIKNNLRQIMLEELKAPHPSRQAIPGD